MNALDRPFGTHRSARPHTCSQSNRPLEPAARLRFAAETPLGRLLLELPVCRGTDAVGAAWVLADAEPLVAALESWLGFDLDPAPVAAAPAPEPDAETDADTGVLWLRAGADGADGWLGLPWPLLAQAPPSALPMLRDVTLPLWAEIARWPALPPRPTAAEDPGLLLLPASFEVRWPVVLVQSELGLELDASWPGPGGPLARTGVPRARPARAARAACVRLAEPLHWPLAAVMGWNSAPDEPPGDQAQAFEAGAADPAFHGCIVPALHGAGLLVPGRPGRAGAAGAAKAAASAAVPAESAEAADASAAPEHPPG